MERVPAHCQFPINKESLYLVVGIAGGISFLWINTIYVYKRVQQCMECVRRNMVYVTFVGGNCFAGQNARYAHGCRKGLLLECLSLIADLISRCFSKIVRPCTGLNAMIERKICESGVMPDS